MIPKGKAGSGLQPVYQSRADQVLDYLRSRLREGIWKEALPAERQLAAQLGVGRHTLRAALAALEKEGLLKERSQRGTLLASGSRTRQKQPASIGVVFSNGVDRVVGKGLVYLDELRYFFARKGIEVVVHRAPFHPRRISVHFQRMVIGFPHALWILISPTDPIQQWCMQHRIPAMMIGNRSEAYAMPAVSLNTRAACRHAVGRMLAKGHRRIALILPIHEKGEEEESRRGFSEAIEESPHRDEVTARLEVHHETKESIRRMVDRLVALKERPTAWLICRQGHYMTIHSYLLGLGTRIPKEISLISRDTDIYLGDLDPEPCRYASDTTHLARVVARYAQRLMDGKADGHPQGELVLIVPDFVEGETLGESPPGA